MLLAYANGASVAAIAEQLHTHRVKVNDTVNRALAIGVRAALRDLPRAGRPRTIPDDARAWVISLTCQKPTEFGYSEELWTTKRLAEHVRRHCGAAGHASLHKLGRGTVSKILAAHELKPHKIRYYLEQRDPDFEAKMVSVLHVYKQVEMLRSRNASGGAVPLLAVLSYDEKPGIQVLQNAAPDLPPVPGKHATVRREQEYIRHGTLSLLCGIDLQTGKILAHVEPRHRSREFIAWLKHVDEAYTKDWKIRIILDNHSAHISKETRSYLATLPNRFEFIFTPTHGSWLNLVEVFFSKLARTLLRGIRADSPEEMKDQIVRHVEELNREPVVFRWTYRLDELDVAS